MIFRCKYYYIYYRTVRALCTLLNRHPTDRLLRTRPADDGGGGVKNREEGEKNLFKKYARRRRRCIAEIYNFNSVYFRKGISLQINTFETTY